MLLNGQSNIGRHQKGGANQNYHPHLTFAQASLQEAAACYHSQYEQSDKYAQYLYNTMVVGGIFSTAAASPDGQNGD